MLLDLEREKKERSLVHRVNLGCCQEISKALSIYVYLDSFSHSSGYSSICRAPLLSHLYSTA